MLCYCAAQAQICWAAVEEAARVTCVRSGGKEISHPEFEWQGSVERWDPSAQPQCGQTWVGWGDAGPPGAGDGQGAPPGTTSSGVRRRDSPHWEYNCAFPLQRPFLSSPKASLLLLLVQDLFFHVW